MKITKQILYEEHVNNRLSARAIGKKYNISDSSIRTYIKKCNIPYTIGHKLRTSQKIVDITNKKFGKLLAIKYHSSTKNGRAIWECICDCGNLCFKQSHELLQNNVKSCCKCPKDIFPYFYYSEIKISAKRRKIEFNISKEYLEKLFIQQNKKCALSNLDLTMPIGAGKKIKYMRTASLDRINSKIGYIENNVQWIHKDINYMKMDLLEKDFINFCKLVANGPKQ